jgi:hypothetical protein
LWEFLADGVRANEVGVLAGQDMQFFPDQKGLESLEKAGFLLRTTDAVSCPLFTEFNEHLDPCEVSQASRGGRAKGWNRSIEEARSQQLMLLGGEPVQRPDGHVLTDVEHRNARAIIRAFDNVTSYSRAIRPDSYPADLVLAAHDLDRRFGAEPVLEVAKRVYLNAKGNPRVPRTTELCFQHFEQLRVLASK